VRGDGPRPPGVLAGVGSQAGPASAASLAKPFSRAARITFARSSGIDITWCLNLHDSEHRPRREKEVQSPIPPILTSEYRIPALFTNDAMSSDGCSRLNFWTTDAQIAGIAELRVACLDGTCPAVLSRGFSRGSRFWAPAGGPKNWATGHVSVPVMFTSATSSCTVLPR
jgi:hypothetical protein